MAKNLPYQDGSMMQFHQSLLNKVHMFNEVEDKNIFYSKPVVKLLHQEENFLDILCLCKSKRTYGLKSFRF